MEWENVLSEYTGKQVRIWIEDLSGEEQTKPGTYTLVKVKKTEDAFLQLYISESQFLAIPLFEADRTRLVKATGEQRFISYDEKAKLRYWVYFQNAS